MKTKYTEEESNKTVGTLLRIICVPIVLWVTAYINLELVIPVFLLMFSYFLYRLSKRRKNGVKN